MLFKKNLQIYLVSRGAKVWQSCRSQKMLKNAYLLAKIGADTAENERNFAENLPKFGKFCENLQKKSKIFSNFQRKN